MKHIAKSLVVAGAVMAAGTVSADVIADLNPYIGADYYQAWMKPKGDFNKILPKDFPGATVYVGTKFHESFGIELGYDWSARKKKSFSNEKFGASTVTGTAKVRRTGGHLDLVGFLPVAECFDLLGSVGFGWVQSKIHSTFTSAQAPTLSSKSRGVFRVGVGGSYMVTDMVGVRAKVSLEGTSSLRATVNGVKAKPYKGTTAASVGAFVKF